ncbi:MAG: AAA family ATPase, partial [Clostridiales bacterium]|nr:AAA family ATPase [Clostridiales bacterium]
EEESRLSRELEEIHVETAALEQKAAFSQENSSRLTRELEALAQEREEICRTLKGSAEESLEKEKKIRELRASIQVLAVQEEQVREKLLAIQREKEEQSRSHRAFFQKRDELSEKKNLLDRECERLRSQTEKLEEEKEKRISYMWEEYEVTPNQARQFFREEYTDPGAMKKQISKLREEIRNLGPVNVNAIEDYKDLRERHTFLSAQYEDLKKAQETLQGIIQELDAGMRRQFTEKFQEIQREFDRAFRELFGGGRGSLELDSDADVLEAGIRIISQPPGKKLQNMMQLSGGEKALTAIALLFAIQNLKPSPFCLLDEIEAALDDSNVGRFASYLQKLTKNTQFIIITHRRGTMNAADRLYGITMQEKGVSTLVSVDLVENQLTS